MVYIRSNKDINTCVFCCELEKEDGPDNLIVKRGQRAFVILNRYPYTSGHLMVVPYIHQPSLEMLDPETRAEIMELTTCSVQVLKVVYQAQGFNLGANIGGASGAGVTEHVHLHIVPRWEGDTNFMSAIAATRVIPEALEESYRRIKEGWDNICHR